MGNGILHYKFEYWKSFLNSTPGPPDLVTVDGFGAI